MANLKPVTYEEFHNKSLAQLNNFLFAKNDALIPIVLEEIPKAAMSAPVVFTSYKDGYIPAMLQGISNNQNLIVSNDGQWLANYIPAPYRAYPFQLVPDSSGQEVLCIDEDSGLISNGPEGKPFFNDDGTPTEFTQSVLNFLAQIHKSKEQTLKVCQLLSKLSLIIPWELKINTPSGEKIVKGIYQVDEGALNNLPINDLNELRISGALPVIYCQLLSQQHVDLLIKLADHYQEHLKNMPDAGLWFDDKNDIFKF